MPVSVPPAMEMEEFSCLHPQQDFLVYMNHMILKRTSTCPPVFAFTTLTGQLIASAEQEMQCGCHVYSTSEEQLWLDSNARLVLGVKEEERGVLSTRRSCVVRSPNTQVIGRVVLKTTRGQQNNSIQDNDYRPLVRFERRAPMFHSMVTSFKLPDGQEIACMKHKQNGARVLMEFSETCSVDLKILIMAAAILYQRRDLATKGKVV